MEIKLLQLVLCPKCGRIMVEKEMNGSEGMICTKYDCRNWMHKDSAPKPILYQG